MKPEKGQIVAAPAHTSAIHCVEYGAVQIRMIIFNILFSAIC